MIAIAQESFFRALKTANFHLSGMYAAQDADHAAARTEADLLDQTKDALAALKDALRHLIDAKLYAVRHT